MGKFDEIFDDVVVNAKAAAAVVSKKASTVYDTSKHKITAAEIRGEINKKLRDIGKYTYKKEVFGVDTSAEVAQLIADVKELKENLDIINAHIDSVKNPLSGRITADSIGEIIRGNTVYECDCEIVRR